MKKHLAYILPLALLLCLGACKKNKKYCWGCNILYYTNYGYVYNDTAICDKTRSQINAIQGQKYDASAQGYEVMEIRDCGRK